MTHATATRMPTDERPDGCGPQKLPQGSKFRSRGRRLKTILVVQGAEDRFGDDTVEGEDPMAAGRSCETIV
jgi:hypothetical protein